LPPRDRRPAHPRPLAVAYGGALVHGQFMLLVSSTALCFSGLFIYVAGSPTLLYRCLGYRPDQFWYLFLPIVAGFLVGAQISGRLAGRHSHAYAVNIGFAILLCAASVQLVTSALFPPRSWSAFPLVMAYAAGMVVTTPNMVLIALDCLPERRGMASAIQSCIQMGFAGIVAGALVPFLSPQLWTFALASLALSAASVGLWTLHSGSAAATDEAAASLGDSRSTA
jgi:DHA1 family bicyclomycin/chloramphenicol resistance-like MFS transporter